MIRRAKKQDLNTLAELGLLLWPGHTVQELESEFADILEKEDAAVFLAFVGEGTVGFSQCQLRYDYVEGTRSSPVGYLEGIYVADEYRRQGIARKLLAESENWAKLQGCREFASDCELENSQSLQFHMSLGFEEANRIICFTKQL